MLAGVNQIRVLAFGVLREPLGSEFSIELEDGATVAHLLATLAARFPAVPLKGIAVSVNAEYAQASHGLRSGDEVGLLPPVSGGTFPHAKPVNASNDSGNSVSLTHDPIDSAAHIAAAKQPEDGAVVVFDGIVRNHSRGRATLYLDYEAYDAMALSQMQALAAEAVPRFGVRRVTLVHRLGRLHIGETSVLIVVASAHRAAAFDACRWLIDTLKQTVPIWKRETFADGAVWAPGEPFPAGLSAEPADAT